MSTPDTAAQDPQAAIDLLVEKVAVPVFFHKLASHGIQPQSEKQAEQLLHLGRQLMAFKAAELQKQAQADSDYLGQLIAHYDAALGWSGSPEATDSSVKAAAVALLQDPEISKAAALLGAA